MNRGNIVALYLVYCGECDSEPMRLEVAYDKVSAAMYARSVGWVHTKRSGWICSDCAWERKQVQRQKRTNVLTAIAGQLTPLAIGQGR